MELKPKAARKTSEPDLRQQARDAIRERQQRQRLIAKTIDEAEEPTQSPLFDLAKVHERMKKVVQFTTFEQPIKLRLQTGSPDLQLVLGSREHGIPYGRMIELSGLEHGGKTLIGNILMGLAQRDGAAAGIVDVEDSADEMWSRKLGVDWDNLLLIKTKLVQHKPQKTDEDGNPLPDKKSMFGKKSKMKAGDPLRPEGAEELFAEMEAAMAALYEQGVPKQFWLIDSLANLVTIKQLEAGTTGQSMNTALDLPAVLARWLPKLSGLAANYNALIVVINQLRNKVGIVFGDPYDTPGGRAARHAFSNRTRVKRLKNGMVKQSGHVVGIIGVLDNQKNKMGFGSQQSEKCGFKVSWAKGKVDYKFMTVKQATDMLGGE